LVHGTYSLPLFSLELAQCKENYIKTLLLEIFLESFNIFIMNSKENTNLVIDEYTVKASAI
jgi:hypothetical protein